MASHEFPVAIIGMAVKLPFAKNCEEFWDMMVNRTDTVSSFPSGRASDVAHVLETFKDQLVAETNPFFAGSYFKQVDKFDVEMFQIDPEEAVFIEPEQRIFLQTVWELFEDAGYASKIQGSNTGVYVSNTISKYKHIFTENHQDISHGKQPPSVSSRISFTYNLRGPSAMVDTQSSSPLLVVHLACRGLLSDDCDIAIAGGITLDLLPLRMKTNIWDQQVNTPNVQCKTFNAQVGKTAKAEGCGAVLLKPLHKAITDGDNIYGVLEATIANQCFNSVSVASSYPKLEVNLLNEAWKLAKIKPEDLGYMYVYRTKSESKDPFEITDIVKAFGTDVTKDLTAFKKIPMDFVTSINGKNIDGGAEIVALIKVLLCIKHSTIPPATIATLHPDINQGSLSMFVNTTELRWESPRKGSVRYGSVSVFGISETSVHAVVREFQNRHGSSKEQTEQVQLLCIAARSKHSLQNFTKSLLTYFTKCKDKTYDKFSSVCYTLNTGRELMKFKIRASLVANSWSQMKCALEKLAMMQNESKGDDEKSYLAAAPYLGNSKITIMNNLQGSQRVLLDRFFKGEKINWDEYYVNTPTEQRRTIGQLPTYCFQNTRFWPAVTYDRNQQHVALRHKTPELDIQLTQIRHESIDLASIEETLVMVAHEVLGIHLHNSNLQQSDIIALCHNSLMLSRLQNRINEIYKVNISVRELKLGMTIPLLANLVYQHMLLSEESPSWKTHDFGMNDTCLELTKLQNLWMTALELESCPANEQTFVECGGNSFKATILQSSVREQFRVSLSVTDILQNPTFSEFCSMIAASLKTKLKRCFGNVSHFENIPLSQAQKRMIVLQRAVPESSAYTVTIAVQTQNEVSIQYVSQALAAHHPILTAQIDPHNATLTCTHAMSYEETVCEFDTMEEVTMHLSASKPVFQLISGALSQIRRVTCTKLKRWLIVVDVHHIVVDDRTLNNIKLSILTILKSAYAKDMSTTAHKMQKNPIIYCDEQAYKMTNEAVNDRTFWESYFQVCPITATLSLTSDSNKSDFIANPAEIITSKLSAEQIEKIQKHCRNIKVTEFQYFLACMTLTVQRYLGTNEVTIAVPVSTRDTDTQTADGLFVNTVLFKYNIRKDVTFNDFILDVSKTWLKCLSHSRYPLERVGQIVWEKHGVSIQSFCNISFNLATFAPLVDEVKVMAKHSKMQMSIDIVPTFDHRYEIVCEYSRDEMDHDIVSRFNETLKHTFEICVNEQNKLIQDTELLCQREINLITSMNRNDFKFEDAESVLEKFLQHTADHPHATAVCCKEKETSYDALYCMALKVEAALKMFDLKVLQNYPVVLCMDKSEKTIAAVFGIWLAGGHFLPISTLHATKLQDIVDTTSPCAIMIDKQDNMKTTFGNCKILQMSEILQYHNCMRDSQSTKIRRLSDTAYIIQTSGSTGAPKRIKISHESLTIIADAYKTIYDMTSYKVNVLQWAPLSFDVFIADVVRALCCAPGTLCICPDEKRLDIEYIRDMIHNFQISFAEVTPQFGLHLVENSRKELLASLKIYILGSDTLQKEVYSRVKSCLHDGQRLFNLYGMSEATIDSASFEGDLFGNTRGGTVPIGKPLPGVTLHVLEPTSLQPCPIGTVGELFIGGRVIGYGDTELVSSKTGEILLKSNDKMCWLPSGHLEFLGRYDDTCKLRGFRINTAEIENTILRKCSEIQDAAVVVNETISGAICAQFLCAFVTLKNLGISKDSVEKHVLEQVKKKHPYYMVPDQVHVLDHIPLTSNGKVNKGALASMVKIVESTLSMDDSNLSSTAQLLKTLFAEALGSANNLHIIDVQRTFMEQGGHSLVLVQFHSLIKQRTQFDIAIADIFRYPSILSLTDYVNRENRTAVNDENYVDTQEISNPSEGCLDMAITGVGMRLPGDITCLSDLWKTMEQEIDLIGDFPTSRSNDVLNTSPESHASNLQSCGEYRGAFLSSIDEFDNTFFGIPAEEARLISPEQRLFLEVATEALCEGTNISTINGKRVGVFLAKTEVVYANLYQSADATEIAGIMPSMIPARVAYQYNLKGPTMLVDTACSSSLVALKIASESIHRGECTSALVGGINIIMYPTRGGVHEDKGILSSEFQCRPFDREAHGTAVGEGVICVYLEPLKKSLQQNKRVYGVVKSIASNSVGKGNGITAPTAKSQELVIKQALQCANMKSSDISFVETHGSGTVLGDKIELSGLKAAFNSSTASRMCRIGSVKSIFGHLSYAAGMIGLMKVLASFTFKKIPPTLLFKNIHSELKNVLFHIPNTTEDWKTATGEVRAAGLSSFGMTGTNCHAVLTEAPTKISFESPQDQVNSKPLLFVCANFKHLKKQAILFHTLIMQTVIKHKINTLTEICHTVANQLKNLTEANLGHQQIRLIIMVETETQVLSILQLINTSESFDMIRNMCCIRKDVHMCKTGEVIPEKSQQLIDSQSDGISIFLQSGFVNYDRLFNNCADTKTTAIGVKLAMFDSRRHWLTLSSKKSFENIRLTDILYRKITKTREIVRNIPLAPSQDLIKMKEEFCSSIIITFLRDTLLSTVMKNSVEIEFHKAFELTGMMGKYNKLFFVMVRELLLNGFVNALGRDPSVYNLDKFSFISRDKHIQDPETIAQKAMVRFPAWADCFRFPLHCSQYLKGVLQGEMSPLAVLFPTGDINFMNQYESVGDLLGKVYYNMYMQLILEYATQLSNDGQKVQILEIGAGIGNAAKQLLPNLAAIQNIEYWFTDFHMTSVENAKKSFEMYHHMMKFSTFNITKNASKQGLLNSYDIIISNNIIHITESIMGSVLNLKSCLGNDGTMFIIENTRNETWAALTWGISDGWWNFKDYEIRPFGPMLEPDKWEAVLRRAGFGSVHSCPQDPEERKHVNKFLFVCSVKECNAQSEYVPNSEWWNSVDVTERRNSNLMVEDVSSTSSHRVLDNDGRIDADFVKRELKRIWCGLLDTQDIQPEDDFRSLGGNSILTLQMMAIVRQHIGCQLDIHDMFCHPSLGSLGDFIVNLLNSSTHSSCRSSHIADSDKRIEREIITFEGQERTMLMFPGQGAQKYSMCLSMAQSEPAKSVFKTAEKVTGYNVLDICLQQDEVLEERLESTEFAQVSLLVGCMAKIEQLKSENPEILASVTHVAGLSVGEYAALVYAGVLTLEKAVAIVQQRGRAMEEEVKRSNSAMASVLGPTSCQLQRFIEDHFPETEIAIYLADNQHTVAGSETDIDKLVKMLSSEQKEDMPVIDVRRLRVAGAFHSNFMEKAAEIICPIIQSCQFMKPRLPVILNSTGKASQDPGEIKTAVMQQLTDSVRWRQTVITAYDLGVRKFLEVAPVQVLSSIVKSRIQHCKGCKTELKVV